MDMVIHIPSLREQTPLPSATKMMGLAAYVFDEMEDDSDDYDLNRSFSRAITFPAPLSETHDQYQPVVSLYDAVSDFVLFAEEHFDITNGLFWCQLAWEEPMLREALWQNRLQRPWEIQQERDLRTLISVSPFENFECMRDKMPPAPAVGDFGKMAWHKALTIQMCMREFFE